MSALFRHLTVRLWLTALVGGWFCLTLLPLWQKIFGLNWLAFPASIIFGICFGAAGWAMNRVGMALAQRQINEGAAWERAGLIREAENAFKRAVAFFDSCWLSPMSRRSQIQRLSGALARFYLNHFPGLGHTRDLVAAHLTNYPQDEAVAESWLEGMVSRERCSDREHEAVARVGEALGRHKPIQGLLLRFYLANGRIDFDARQVYRWVWKEQQPVATELVHRLAHLLRNESIVNPWALQVYIRAYQTGDPDALEGIAAGLSLLPVSAESRSDLATARKLVADLDAGRVRRLAAKFTPQEMQPSIGESAKRMARQRTPIGITVIKAPGEMGSAFLRRIGKIVPLARSCFRALARRQVWYALCIAGAGALVAFYVISERPASESVKPEPPDASPVEVKPVVTDPFTIQVAAYLKFEDAQRFVDQLAHKKLDAFWTKATSANRTWYQVKVSRFATRETAQRFGQELKAKGVIDDFYVANFEMH